MPQEREDSSIIVLDNVCTRYRGLSISGKNRTVSSDSAIHEVLQ